VSRGHCVCHSTFVLRKVPTIVAVLFVLAAYAYFGSYGTFAFRSRPWDVPGGRPGDAYYGALSEGFLRGQLSMAYKADPRLMALPHPYDYAAREKAQVPYMWDASYYNGRYYLYFTPLPALFFYIPFRLAYTAYPSDQLAAAVFSAWAFIMAALFVKRALGPSPRIPPAIWIVMLGLGGVVPFIMVYSRVYEVATLCGMAMTATWAWCLLRYLESPRISRLVWMCIWLGFSIAARPNVGLLLVIAFLAIPKALRLRHALIALIPLGVIAGALLAYNYARFHNPLEFGIRYQLTYMPMADYRVCGCGSFPEVLRVVNNSSLYLFAPPYVGGTFPYADLPSQRLDPAVSFNERSEEVGGLVPLIPIAAIGSVIAAFLALRRNGQLPTADTDTGTRAAVLIIAAGWLALLGLAACWYVTPRYQVDFMLLIAAGAAVVVDRTLDTRGLRAVAIALALYSVLLGFMLGLKGTGGAFARENPKLFQRLSELF
jgi:hypothetical protein